MRSYQHPIPIDGHAIGLIGRKAIFTGIGFPIAINRHRAVHIVYYLLGMFENILAPVMGRTMIWPLFVHRLLMKPKSQKNRTGEQQSNYRFLIAFSHRIDWYNRFHLLLVEDSSILYFLFF